MTEFIENEIPTDLPPRRHDLRTQGPGLVGQVMVRINGDPSYMVIAYDIDAGQAVVFGRPLMIDVQWRHWG